MGAFATCAVTVENMQTNATTVVINLIAILVMLKFTTIQITGLVLPNHLHKTEINTLT
jgi:hypothetical protein